MHDFADAVVGCPGQGLNVEQRKLLTIGIELVAKPKLLLFVDEPTSNLDSESAWGVVNFLRRLSDAGQAILCTVHQPSAVLFEQFDRVLLLAEGGRTAYFGDVGANSRTICDYFEGNGARRCSDEENPAEYIMELCKDAGCNQAGEEWHAVWARSEERGAVMLEVERIHEEKSSEVAIVDPELDLEFATPFSTQLWVVTRRVFVTYWRMPSYILPKMLLVTLAGLFIGFTFYDAQPTFAGMETSLFAGFIVVPLLPPLLEAIQPHYVTQRTLFEIREQPSKTYSWKAFLFANLVVETPYTIMSAILLFATFYYPVQGIQTSYQQGLVLLFCLQFMFYIQTLSHMLIAALPIFPPFMPALSFFLITFAGVIQPANLMPDFWIFMYRCSPLTYYAAGMIAVRLHDRPVECNRRETSIFDPPANQTCGEYLAPFLELAPSKLHNPDDTSECQVCPMQVADQFLAGSRMYWSERWQNYGILWAFCGINIIVAVASFYFVKVRVWNKKPTRGA
jgi:ATP-binding cassette subfamily G (WHITE) protein 2 (PDR)